MDVLEHRHTALKCLAQFGKGLKLFSTESLLLYFVFMFVKAENPLLHKYVVAKGISLDSTLSQRRVFSAQYYPEICQGLLSIFNF